MQLRTRQFRGGTARPSRWGIDSEHGVLRDVLVGPIKYFSWQTANAVAARSERVGLRFDPAVAQTQYAEMLDAYRQAGVTVHSLEPTEGLSYQLFARDSSVMTPWGAIIMQLEKPFRRGENAACLRFYLENEIPIYDIVTAGNVEGGDFMVLKPGVAVCGFSGERSSETAVRQIKAWFEAEGWEFKTYAFDPHFLHLDVQFGMLAEGLAVACTEALEAEFLNWLADQGIRLIDVSYGDAMKLGTNVVALGNERVMIPRSSKALIEICRAEGLTVLDPDVSMISHSGGAIHCMCQALARDPVA